MFTKLKGNQMTI